MKKLICVVLLCIGLIVTLAGCDADPNAEVYRAQNEEMLHSAIQNEVDSPTWVKNLPAANDDNNKQMIIVAGMGMDKTTAYVSMHRRDEQGNWKQYISTPGFIGENGMCLDEEHVKGSKKTPIGTFYIKRAFGIAPNPGCKMAYNCLRDVFYWSGDPAEGMRYNELVNTMQIKNLNTEISKHIFDHEYAYQFCFDIGFNEEADPERDFGIFIHCLSPDKPYTDGGIAIPEDIMKLATSNALKGDVVIIDTAENLGVEW
ncbi:MAG: hypothetical protein K5644_04330 [Lachnospiraceae bacterium]|nr:hypothetical protein [Lachnospiraceae bacterium]